MPFIVLKVKDSTHLDPPTFVPEGTIEIDSNGTHNVAQYEFIKVDIETSKIKKIYAHEFVTWILKDDNTLWGCGKNDHGQQGSGDTTAVKKFTQRMEDVKDVVCSNDMTWVIKNDNTLWGCGYNAYGQQGAGNKNDVLVFTKRASNVSKVVIDSKYSNSTWYISTSNYLYGCGYNYDGQQGSGSSGSGTDVTTFTQRLTSVKDVVVSSDNTFAIKSNNKLYGCGYNGYGQIGKSSSTSKVTSFTNTLSKTIKQVCANLDSTVVLGTDGYVYGCGRNSYGHISGSSSNKVESWTSSLNSSSNQYPATSIINGGRTLFIRTSSRLYGRGYNGVGCLGTGDTENKYSLCQISTSVSSHSIGGEYVTTWVLKSDNTLWGCGDGGHGKQGNGSTNAVTSLTQRLSNVKKVYATENTTWVLKNDGTLWGCGYNHYGQQGSGDTTDITAFTKRLENVVDFYTADVEGSQSAGDGSACFAIKEDGSLWLWGFNSYGKLGTGDSKDVLVPTRRKLSQL